MNKLYLSDKDKKIAGVCGGIEEAYGFDSTLCRLLVVIFTLASGILPGVILYLAAVVIIPGRPKEEGDSGGNSNPPGNHSENIDRNQEDGHKDDENSDRGREEPKGFAKLK